MVNIRSKDSPSGSESPKVEVGEIDTRAPFQSVKAAVSLFGEVVASKGRPAIRRAKSSSENVLDKETQLLLAQRETNKFKQVLEITEITKAKALGDLDTAKRTVQELTSNLNKALESKQLAMEATESIRDKATHLERVKSQNEAGITAWKELCTTREQYHEAAAELDAAKQELAKVRQDFDAALETKTAAFHQAAEGRRSAKINLERASELSDQIGMMRGSLEHLKAASGQAMLEQAKIVEEKEERLQMYMISKEEAEKKIACLKEELIAPEEVTVLESRLADMTDEIEAVQEEMKRVHVSDTDLARTIMIELDAAARALKNIAEEEILYRNLIDSLRKELENVKKERAYLAEQVQEIELAAMRLQTELQNSKSELMVFPSRGEASGNYEQEAMSTMMANSPNKVEDGEAEEEIRRAVEELKREAEINRAEEQEAKRQLESALEEAKAVKTSEKAMLERMKSMSVKMDSVDPSVSPPSGWIKMPLQHFESMSRKVEESDNLAEMKLAAANFQMEAVSATKSEMENQVDAILKEIEQIKAAMELALKQAEMDEAAKTAIEGELTKRRQQENDVEPSSIAED